MFPVNGAIRSEKRYVIWSPGKGDGFLLLYKRLEAGSFSWPRSRQEAAELTREQYHLLMMGFDPVTPKIREVTPHRIS